jgi:GAF domain-containing protein
LIEVSNAISSARDLDQILRLTCRSAVELMGVSHSGLVLFDDRLESGTVKAEYPEETGTLGTRIQISGIEAEERLISSSEPLVIPDVRAEASLGSVREMLTGFGVRSIAIVPIVSEGKLLGSLSLDAIGQKRQFSRPEIEFVQALARQVSIAIENAKLLRTAQEKTSQLEALRRTTLAVTSQLDQKQVLTTVIEQAVKLLAARSGGIYEYRSAEGELAIIADFKRPHYVGSALRLGDGMAGRLIETGAPYLIVDDYDNWPGRAQGYQDSRSFGAVLEVPMKWQGASIGVLYVDDAVGRRFTDREAELLSAFADQAAVALMNAQFLSRERDARNRSQLLVRASRVVGEAGTLSEGLRQLTEMLSELLGRPICQVWVAAEGEGSLILKSALDSTECGRAVSNRMSVPISQWPHLSSERGSLQPILLAREDDRVRPELEALCASLGQANPLEYLLVAPLRAGSGQTGVLLMGETRRGEQYRPGQGEIEIVAAIAAQTSALMERLRAYEFVDRRRPLLARLAESSKHLLVGREPKQMRQEVTHLATELVDARAAALFTHYPHSDELEIVAVQGIGQQAVGRRDGPGLGIAGLVVRSGATQVQRQCGWDGSDPEAGATSYDTVVAVPLRGPGGVQGVLLVAGGEMGPAEIDVLERYSAQASIALESAELSTSPERMVRSLRVLQRVRDYIDYIQSTDDLDRMLHVVLTAVTAGHGLAFNRASLFLFDEHRHFLIGKMAIGQVTPDAVERAWDHDRQLDLDNFESYFELLSRDEIPPTELDALVRGLRIPVRENGDSFSECVLSQRWISLAPQELARLPEDFLQVAAPTTTVVLVPLVVRKQGIGLMAVDNKFRGADIPPEEIDALITFANTAATAVGREKFRSLETAARVFESEEDPLEILNRIAEKTANFAGADGMVALAINPDGAAELVAPFGRENAPRIDLELIRCNAISQRVMETRQPHPVEDADTGGSDFTPAIFREPARAAICLPFMLRGRVIGVVWLWYHTPHRFSSDEIDVLHVYADQLAVAHNNAIRIFRQQSLHHAAQKMSAAFESAQARTAIVDQAVRVFQAHSAVLWPYDAELEKFVEAGLTAQGPAEDELACLREHAADARAMLECQPSGLPLCGDLRKGEPERLGPHTREALLRTGAAGFHSIPLQVGAEPLGVLGLSYRWPREITQEDRYCLDNFAGHAAVSLKKAGLLAQLRRLNEVARLVARATVQGDYRQVLLAVAKGTVEALGCDAVVLYGYDETTRKIDYPPAMAGVQYRDRVVQAKSVPPGSLVRKMLAQDEMYKVPDVNLDPIFKSARFAADEAVRSCIAVPLRVAGHRVGMMFVNYRVIHRFNEEELAAIELLANLAAVAIRDAQVHEQLKASNREKSEYISVISHELQTPLAYVRYTIENLLSGVSGYVKTEQCRELESALDRVREEGRLVRNLLDVVRIQAGKAELQAETVDLHELLKAGVQTFEYQAHQKGVRLDLISGGNAVPKTVHGDRDKLMQVVTNLVSNAIKFTPAGGMVAVAAEQTGTEIRVHVKDTGVGIGAEELPDLFERFCRLGAERHAEGMGIGLSIVKRWVEMHGGRIWATSELGTGSCFSFALPAADPTPSY